MQIIRQTYTIDAPVEKVWKALTSPEIIAAWGAGPAKMDDKVGTMFSLWGGDVFGTNIEVEPLKKLVQEWIEGKWDQPSKVTFTLTSQDNQTIVNLEHIDVPDDAARDIEDGWNRYYLGEIKKYLET